MVYAWYNAKFGNFNTKGQVVLIPDFIHLLAISKFEQASLPRKTFSPSSQKNCIDVKVPRRFDMTKNFMPYYNNATHKIRPRLAYWFNRYLYLWTDTTYRAYILSKEILASNYTISPPCESSAQVS